MRLRLEAWGYVLTVEPRRTHERAKNEALLPRRIPPFDLRVFTEKAAREITRPYLECSVCHRTSPHLDNAGERCNCRIMDEADQPTKGRACGGVMVERPYDPIYGTGWPGDVPIGGGR